MVVRCRRSGLEANYVVDGVPDLRWSGSVGFDDDGEDFTVWVVK